MKLYKIGQFFRENWIRLLVSFLIGIILMVLYNVINKGVDAPSWSRLEYYRDGSFIAAMALFFIGLLALISQFGFFDIFSFFAGRKRKEDGKKENFGEYVERKNLTRGHIRLYFLSYILIALIYAIFSLICYFVLR